jgi:hypothetical protein
MTTLTILLQIVIALGIFNVWALRQGKATPWRPLGARNMAEEFRHYGLPDWMRRLVGAMKMSLATLLLIGVWYQSIAVVAATGISVLMAFAVLAHIKVRDPWVKSAPAFSMMVLSVAVIVGRGF